jgi:putative PIN family toxin of toxin-antitoxin system
MRSQKNKVIIDTNLWINFLLTKALSRFDSIIARRRLNLIFSQELVDEFVEVTQRKKFRKYFSLQDVESLLIKIRNRAIFIEVTSRATTCRDAKDNFLLALATDSRATHLITGDKDLLILERYGNTKILTISEYLTELHR